MSEVEFVEVTDEPLDCLLLNLLFLFNIPAWICVVEGESSLSDNVIGVGDLDFLEATTSMVPETSVIAKDISNSDWR